MSFGTPLKFRHNLSARNIPEKKIELIKTIRIVNFHLQNSKFKICLVQISH